MPELAEIKIMSEYINSVCENQDFWSIGTSPEVSKRLGVVQPSNLQMFSISAEARGKELLLILSSGADSYTMSVSMGMSGYWVFGDRDSKPKHSHLIFNTIDKKALFLVDVRRFAKWKWGGWSPNRGPCPVKETTLFKTNVINSLNKKVFSKAIHLLLMDQKYFNGIGNYLRAEILYLANQDPFESAREAIINNPVLLDLCTQVSYEAYMIGGGQLKDWKNPFQVPKNGFSDWIKCYGKAEHSILDANRRTLWYSKSQLKDKND